MSFNAISENYQDNALELKVCGMRDKDNLAILLDEVRPSYIGSVYYAPSPRTASLEQLSSLNSLDMSKTKKVLVTVNETLESLFEAHAAFLPDVFQLHGNEGLDYIDAVRTILPDVQIWKSISIAGQADLELLIDSMLIDRYVCETKSDGFGGSGKQFDWNILNKYSIKTPFMLTGGITPYDAERVLNLMKSHHQMLGADINTQFEISPGIKDVPKIKIFYQALKEN